ncbi:MAG: alpha-2-macroglobulin, partial [Verrucomicrobia bacterium]|nr:alpha-2-macroglobulin [Verrucomicrobiota bacterium]
MLRTWIHTLSAGVFIVASLGSAQPLSSHTATLEEARTLQKDGNIKEAFERYERLCLDAAYTGLGAQDALERAVQCQQRLNQMHAIDPLLEATVAARPHDWRMLATVARQYSQVQHAGYIIAGEFSRGHHRGGGRAVNSRERDRVRSLQLLERARQIALSETTHGSERGNLCLQLADALRNGRRNQESWRLQMLTDLTELPDYEDGFYYGHHGDARKAPVDASGNPIFHARPESYDTATTDGQRWRAVLDEAACSGPHLRNGVVQQLADFSYEQFGVQTMAEYGWFFHRSVADGDTRNAAFTLDTLTEDETMAKLATGIKRFSLPKAYNYIASYRELTARSNTGQHAINRLAEIFENRRQYDKAVSCWKQSIERHGDHKTRWKQKRIDQIQQNWGQFESVSTHPAGQKASVEFRFRNGDQVHFEARTIKTRALLQDIKEYLRDNPRQIEHEKLNIHSIGHRLIHQDEKRYIGDSVAKWSEALTPRPGHFDRRVTITSPLTEAGAYLLTAKMQDGNTSTVVIWITDTVIVHKRLDSKPYYFVADAITGTPVPGATVEFFGYRQQYLNSRLPGARRHDIITTHFAEKTNARGEVMPVTKTDSHRYRWLITASTPDSDAQPDEVAFERFAFLGFTHMWTNRRHDQDYKARKVFTITDRPVYRPNQAVKYKLWVRQAQYDKADVSQYANQTFDLRIHNPKNEEILKQQVKADAFGGIDGELALPEDAALGVYRIHLHGIGGQGSFRVEEYKKPEFEVTVEAPDKPIMLGETITATVKANYYFGAPVTEAKVKIKVLRNRHEANWYPGGPWDWFYGPGYWWFGYDYPWYPGWHKWGCMRPIGWWWPTQHQPPEVVAEIEQTIGSDGTVSVEIDTAMAKAMHGDDDHRYELTVEVTDKSRRTIVGKGSVLVAREPFKVYAWLNRGHYRKGDTIQASFSAHTLDNKPVTGEGKATLYRIAYEGSEPAETAVEEWNLPTDTTGKASLQIAAAKPGQYRIAYAVTDTEGHTRNGAHIFVVMGEETASENSFRFNAIELVPERREYAAGETVRLRVNTEQANSTVVLFLRPSNGIYLKP